LPWPGRPGTVHLRRVLGNVSRTMRCVGQVQSSGTIPSTMPWPVSSPSCFDNRELQQAANGWIEVLGSDRLATGVLGKGDSHGTDYLWVGTIENNAGAVDRG